MSPTPAKIGSRTRLEARIVHMHEMLERARKDRNQLFIDMAERDLNNLLDQLPRTSQQPKGNV